jgi:hypothetical protein
MVKVYSTVFWQRIRLPQMGPQNPEDVTRDAARDLSAVLGDIAHLSGRIDGLASTHGASVARFTVGAVMLPPKAFSPSREPNTWPRT